MHLDYDELPVHSAVSEVSPPPKLGGTFFIKKAFFIHLPTTFRLAERYSGFSSPVHLSMMRAMALVPEASQFLLTLTTSSSTKKMPY